MNGWTNYHCHTSFVDPDVDREMTPAYYAAQLGERMRRVVVLNHGYNYYVMPRRPEWAEDEVADKVREAGNARLRAAMLSSRTGSRAATCPVRKRMPSCMSWRRRWRGNRGGSEEERVQELEVQMRRFMMKRVIRLFAMVVMGAGQLLAQQPAEFFFKNGDRVVFIGDSITAQGMYTSTIELYLATRFPKWEMTVLNAGINSDSAAGGRKRFDEHVLGEKPTAVVINFGMNDGGYKEFEQSRCDRYANDTEAMLEMAKKAGVRVALLSPNAVDRRRSVDKNYDMPLYLETQRRFYAPLKEVADRNGAAYADQYSATRAIMEKIWADKADDITPWPDAFHPSSMGGLLMAHAILTGLHAPAMVSDVAIDAKTGKVTASACQVVKVNATEKGVTFERLDEALPMPIQKEWAPLLPYVNHLKELNWYGLKVAGLAPGKYAVLIDGQDVASFTAAELAAGVNLGNLMAGPLFEQGNKVRAMIGHNSSEHRFVHIMCYRPGGVHSWLAEAAEQARPKALRESLDRIIAGQRQAYKLAQPVPHQFEVREAK